MVIRVISASKRKWLEQAAAILKGSMSECVTGPLKHHSIVFGYYSHLGEVSYMALDG